MPHVIRIGVEQLKIRSQRRNPSSVSLLSLAVVLHQTIVVSVAVSLFTNVWLLGTLCGSLSNGIQRPTERLAISDGHGSVKQMPRSCVHNGGVWMYHVSSCSSVSASPHIVNMSAPVTITMVDKARPTQNQWCAVVTRRQCGEFSMLRARPERKGQVAFSERYLRSSRHLSFQKINIFLHSGKIIR